MTEIHDERNKDMAAENRSTSSGKITQIIGAVLDIKFADGQLPEINEAIRIARTNGEELVVEVAQHLGDDTVRCIAMGPTDGLVRGMDATATGASISVPVGENTLGRIFNVLGQPIDNKPAPTDVSYEPIHRPAPGFSEQSTTQELLETGIKVVDLLCPYQKGGHILKETAAFQHAEKSKYHNQHCHRARRPRNGFYNCPGHGKAAGK